MTANPSRQAFRWSWLALYFITALLVTHSFAHYTGLEKSWRASLNMLVDGTAHRPFASRLLMTSILRASDYVPEPVQDATWELMSKTGFHPEFLQWNYHEFVFECVAAICFFLTAIFSRRAYAIVFRAPPVESSVAALLYLIGVPLWFRYYNYIYDPSTVALSTALVYAALARRPWFFALAFLLACVNKETAIVILPLWSYVLWADKKRVAAAAWLVILGISWLAIRYACMRSVADAPGTNFEWHFWDHNAVLLQYTFGSALYSGLVLLTELSLAFWGWKNKPRVLRVGFLFSFIPLFTLLATTGFVDELRSLYEVYPFVMLLALTTLCETLGLRDQRLAPAA